MFCKIKRSVFILCLTVFLAAVKAADPEVVSFYPASGCKGIHEPGENVKMVIALKNPSGQAMDITAECTIKDFFDKPYGKRYTCTFRAEPGKTGVGTFVFEAPRSFGHYTVDAVLSSSGMKKVSGQSAFSVLDTMKKRDPFFGLDNGYFGYDLLPAYARCGIGTLELMTQMWHSGPDYRDLEPFMRTPEMQNVMKSDFNLIFDFACMTRHFQRNGVAPQVEARLKKGLLPFTDKDLDDIEKYAEELGRLTRGRITYYQLSQEYDVSVLRPQIYGDATTILAEYVQVGRRIAKGVKRGNPDAKVAALGTMGIDYYRRNPPFPMSRMILDGLGKDWDLIMIHAYSQGRVGEDRKIRSSATLNMREFIMASSALSVSYGRSADIINGERGAACYYDAPFDSDDCRTVACDTAQSLIISKTTPTIVYCAHFGVNPQLGLRALDPKVRKRMNQTTDFSFIWKSVVDETCTEGRLVPRPAGVAYAVASRQLGFTKYSNSYRFGRIYAYTFAREDGTSVAALWSDGKESRLIMDLPDGSTIVNITGGIRKVSGKTDIDLNDFPVYLNLPRAAADLDALIAGAKPAITSVLESAGRRLDLYYASIFLRSLDSKPMKGYMTIGGKKSDVFTLPPLYLMHVYLPLPRGCKGNVTAKFVTEDGRSFDIPFCADYTVIPKMSGKLSFTGKVSEWQPYKSGTVKVPDNVWPRSMLMLEYNLFRKDGTDPDADYYFASDDRYFYFAVDMKDRTHYQPGKAGRGALKYDSVQFCFSRSRLAPHKIRPAAADLFRPEDYHFGMALTAEGAKVFHLSSGPDRESGVRNYPCCITRTGKGTFYEAAIPWKDVKLARVGGGGFRFSFAVTDKNSARDNLNWSLVLSPGMTVLQDSAEFPTLVNQE